MAGWQPLWYVLLLAVPVAVFLHWTGSSPVAVFLASGLAIVPLAAFMGRATDALAIRLGPQLGGLLNATFGNAAELILALIALRHGLTVLVKASLTGSIIGNALLVLGTSLLVGGLRNGTQKFDRVSASLQSTLLVLAAIGLVVPSALYHLIGSGSEVQLSTEVAIVLLMAYLLSLVFSLIKGDRSEEMASGPVEKCEPPAWRPWLAAGVLAGATALVALLSEFLTGAIAQGGLEAWGMSKLFVGAILVALVGNAAEHSTAVLMAYRNKVDVALHVAVGSSLQIALLVTPILVFSSLAFGPQPLDLHFTILEVLAVVASVVVVALVGADGESHWMEGVLLLAVYFILALAFYHMPAVQAAA
jgi:Ca2+:H+ antiporter